LKHLGALFIVGVAVITAAPARARAHAYAASSFDGFTNGRDLRFDFRLDATSVIELHGRAHPGTPPIAREQIAAHAPLLLDYVARTFTIANGGADCPAALPGSILHHPTIDKVVFTVVYRCAADLDVLTLRSRLFHEEDTPHQIIGTFHHRRALEHYFLSPGAPEAVIPVNRLAQVMPVVADGSRQFRTATPPPGAFAPPPRPSSFLHFAGQGVLHILGGIDHLLFVLSLVIVIRQWGQLAAVITSFTIAHSLTLAAGALGLARLSPRIVEPMIALSIIYVAIENVVRLAPRARVGVTFAFGLMHGFGFSSVLADLGLQRAQLVPALLGFNLGVEAGQLLVVVPLFPLVLWLQRNAQIYRRTRIGVNASVAVVACVWFVQRLMGSLG
jgi:hydrogenase/urease accessory protein HupE